MVTQRNLKQANREQQGSAVSPLDTCASGRLAVHHSSSEGTSPDVQNTDSVFLEDGLPVNQMKP